MPGLLDIAPLKRVVSVLGTDVTVTGISAEGIAVVLQRFPEVRKMMTGKDVNLSPEELIAKVPVAVATIIAAGCGTPGDAASERVAASLPLESQIALLEAIKELTLPAGVGPFVDRLAALFGDAVALTSIQDTKSPKPSNT